MLGYGNSLKKRVWTGRKFVVFEVKKSFRYIVQINKCLRSGSQPAKLWCQYLPVLSLKLVHRDSLLTVYILVGQSSIQSTLTEQVCDSSQTPDVILATRFNNNKNIFQPQPLWWSQESDQTVVINCKICKIWGVVVSTKSDFICLPSCFTALMFVNPSK